MVPSSKALPLGSLLVVVVASALTASTVPAAADGSAGGPALEVTQVIYPVIDTDVHGTTTVPSHWLPTLEVANGGTPDSPESRASYLRFDVKSNIPGTLKDARLEMTLKDPAAAGPTTLTTGFVNNDTWVPTRERAEQPQFEMTGATKLPATDIAGTSASVQVSHGTAKYSAQVGQAALSERAGDGKLSLRVTADQVDPGKVLSFFSDEGGIGDQRPHLVLTTVLTDPKEISDVKQAQRDLASAQALLETNKTATADLPLTSRALSPEAVAWSSWDSDVISDDGKVTRPQKAVGDATVKLDVTVTNGPIKLTDRFEVNVPALETAQTPPASPAAKVETVELEPTVNTLITEKWSNQFNHVQYPQQNLANELTVAPGGSIQAAIDSLAAQGGGVVRLTEGVYTVGTRINLKNLITLVGAGRDYTVIQYEGTGTAIGTTQRILSDVVVKDLTLKGDRGSANLAHGVLLEGVDPVASRHSRIALQNITVKDFTVHGVHMKRSSNIIMSNANIHQNGSANGLYHNVYWLFDNNILQSDVDMSNPVRGKGAKYTSTSNVIVQRAQIRNSTVNGVQADGANDDKILFHKFDITGSGKTALWFIAEIFSNPNQYTEDTANAPRDVIISESKITGNKRGGVWKIASNVTVLNSTFANTDSDLLLMKSYPTLENTTFTHPPQYFTDPSQVPLF
ncbi:hypothetical protein StoSoilA2_21380 [Arthrobacter sp. StoSoilA2]|uniref:immunoglobulin-like domain-containing protein n=1 Tax=Arthrobacter sp. StoSoilA2 TaxID=2830990 RepID=UPI001CC7E58B|nr:immunoglobulin-like domain-containing protein [Arthrobacter sp. StoSoilA2]BCW36082.1 hypothetical protein StoSoilA2_21380 [Arthrobacter sp. StoSoilA2]